MDQSAKLTELPDSINSFKFATSRCVEIAAMTESILRPSKTKLIFQTLPIHMRRRVMSHNCKRLPKKLRDGHLEQLKKSGLPPKQKRPSRKYRRRPANLLEEYNRRQRRIAWLETHIWHAKRFHMIERWEYRIAYASCDKAFRACYRASSAHCLIQDLSYCTSIKITGTIENIKSYFSKFTSNKVGLGICSKAYANGSREGSIHLYNSNCFPHGYIDKIYFIWEPSDLPTKCLWLFIHPAVINEVKSILCPENSDSYETANKKRKTENDQSNLIIEILPGRFNRFRLTGPNSHAVLARSLKCVENIEKVLTDPWIAQLAEKDNLFLNEKYKYWNEISMLNSPSQLPKGMVLGLIVKDPRLSRPTKRTKAVNQEEQQCNIQTLLTIPKYASTTPLWQASTVEAIKQNRMTNGQFIKHITDTQLVPGEVNMEDPALQSIPVILIQKPGSQDSHKKKVGYASGWDIMVPSGYALPFWHTFIMFGARAGGLRESENIAFEMGEEYFPPDSNAGMKEENRIEKEKKEKYFRKPPSKRVNFIKLGIKSPFRCPWKILLKDWSTDVSGKKELNYFVLRDRMALMSLQNSLKNQKTVPKSEHEDRLVPVYIKLLGKGSLSDYALICEPLQIDRIEKTFEPQHEDHCEIIRKQKRKEHKILIKKMRRKNIKTKRKMAPSANSAKKTPKKKKGEITEYMKMMKELWLPSDIKSIRNHGIRQVLGFITKGAFSFTESKCCGVGYLAYNALCCLIEKGQSQVLIRNTTSRKYRIAEIDIIQNV